MDKKKQQLRIENVDQMSWEDGAFKVVLGEVPDVSLFKARDVAVKEALPGEDSGALVSEDEEPEENPS